VAPDSVPRYAPAFVTTVIALMLTSAVFLLEPWPFTAFRLFSVARVDQQSAWSATVVNLEGEELAYPLGGEDHGFRGFPFTMAEFVEASRERQDELCRTWVEGAPTLIDEEAREVRLYLRTWRLSERDGDRAASGETVLRYVCTDLGASVAEAGSQP